MPLASLPMVTAGSTGSTESAAVWAARGPVAPRSTRTEARALQRNETRKLRMVQRLLWGGSAPEQLSESPLEFQLSRLGAGDLDSPAAPRRVTIPSFRP